MLLVLLILIQLYSLRKPYVLQETSTRCSASGSLPYARCSLQYVEVLARISEEASWALNQLEITRWDILIKILLGLIEINGSQVEKNEKKAYSLRVPAIKFIGEKQLA